MFQVVLDWSEVWALFFPLAAYYTYQKQPSFLTPVLIYLVGALVLNLLTDFVADFRLYLPGWLQTNLIFYNIHSIFRFICFTYFFNTIAYGSFKYLRNILLSIYLLLLILNYIFLEDYLDQTHINGNLFTIEAYLLLIFSMLYYLTQLRNDVVDLSSSKEFWIVTGLSIYVVINFYIFLFYVPMIQENPMLVEKMWSVHNIAYIVLCLFITKALYVPLQPDHRI